jgi:membrane-bound lytic murein transglycosylase D
LSLALGWAGAAAAQLREPVCPTHGWQGARSFEPVEDLQLPQVEAEPKASPAPTPAALAATQPAATAPAAQPAASPSVPQAAPQSVQSGDVADQDEDLEDEGEGESPPDELQSAKEVEANALEGVETLQLLRARAFAAPGAGSPLACRLGDALSDDAPSAQSDAREAQAIDEEIERFATFDIGSAAAHYDIPVELNEQVSQYIRLFQGPIRDHFVQWLSRATRYVPRMREILTQQGLPVDTVYLALIESGFSTQAYSPARAAGQWQFIGSTGRRFGLHNDFWVDERRDPEKATLAAAGYLKELHEQLGSWYLAWAGYNAGAGTIMRAIRHSGTTDFWALIRGHVMKKETKGYVPKLIAAALIAKHPHAFGFDDVAFMPPLEYEEVETAKPTDLDQVAAAAGVDVSVIRELNPALRRFCTPPSRDGAPYKLRVPVGTKVAVLAALAKLPPLSFKYHKSSGAETAAQLARLYSVKPEQILRMNGLRKLPPKAGRELVIPVPATEATDLRVAAIKDEREVGRRRRVWRWKHGHKQWFYSNGGGSGWRASDDGQDPWHGVNGVNAEDDELEAAAERGPSAAATPILTSNPTPTATVASPAPTPDDPKAERAGPQAALSRAAVRAPRPRPPPVPEEPPPADAVRYTVAEGDSLWSISQAHGIDFTQLCKWNKIRKPASHRLYPGEELWVRNAAPDPKVAPPAPALITAAAPAGSTQTISYQVQDGDNLWQISRKLKVKVEDILRDNHLDGDGVLQPGMNLKVQVTAPQ